MKRNLYLKVAVIFIALYPSFIFAQTDRARVEVIIFEQINKSNEEKRRYPGEIDTTDTIDVHNTGLAAKSNVLSVSKNHYLLNNERRRLAGHKNYRVLEHIAWEQDYDSEKRMPIYITPEKLNSISFSDVEVLVNVRPYQNQALVDIDAIARIQGNEFASRISSRKVIGKRKIYYFDHPDFGVLLQVTPMS